VETFASTNAALLAKRDEIQAQLDTFYLQRQGVAIEQEE
jgi:hypothetical protein